MVAKRKTPHIGMLVVITGGTGAGKDYISSLAINSDEISHMGIQRLITCTSRPADPKRNEKDGVDYFFISEEEIFDMHKNGDLVEEPIKYGSSFKATPKKEFLSIINGNTSKFWRIEPSLASKVADGSFFEDQFPGDAEVFKQITLVLLVDVSEDQLRKQQQKREGDNYEKSKKEYEKRMRQDRKYIKKLQKTATVITNIFGKEDEAVTKMKEAIKQHYAKVTE